jgi:hypothetical protein
LVCAALIAALAPTVAHAGESPVSAAESGEVAKAKFELTHGGVTVKHKGTEAEAGYETEIETKQGGKTFTVRVGWDRLDAGGLEIEVAVLVDGREVIRETKAGDDAKFDAWLNFTAEGTKLKLMLASKGGKRDEGLGLKKTDDPLGGLDEDNPPPKPPKQD